MNDFCNVSSNKDLFAAFRKSDLKVRSNFCFVSGVEKKLFLTFLLARAV